MKSFGLATVGALALATMGGASPVLSGNSVRETKPLEIQFGMACVSKRYTGYECGEDGISYATANELSMLAVADGLGGHAAISKGSAALSNGIVNQLKDYILDSDVTFHEKKSPLDLLMRAYFNGAPKALTDGASGSTTASVGLIDLQAGLMRTANLGDSRIVVLRAGEIVFETREVSYFFNAPGCMNYYSSEAPKENLRKNVERFKQTQIQEFQLAKGDIIIASSDGLHDNLFDDEIILIIRATANELMKEYRDKKIMRPFPTEFAQSLVEKAGLAAVGKWGHGQRPFYRNLVEYRLDMNRHDADPHTRDLFMQHYGEMSVITRGGKPDDISVVVGYVQ